MKLLVAVLATVLSCVSPLFRTVAAADYLLRSDVPGTSQRIRRNVDSFGSKQDHVQDIVSYTWKHLHKRALSPSNNIRGTFTPFLHGSGKLYMTFEYPDYQATVDEDVHLGSELIRAKLKNSPPDGLEVTVHNGNFTARIDGDTVIITNNNTLDYDDNGGFYMFAVNVQVTSTGESAAASIRIFTRNKNDEAPKFTQAIYSNSIDELAKENALVSTVVATDKDGDKVTYSFKNGDTIYKFFSIDSKNGVIRLTGTIDFEEDNYELNVTAKDDGSCCNDGTKTIHETEALVLVKIIDVNDHKPVFRNCESIEASVKENQPAAHFIIKVEAIDADRGANGEVDYSVVDKPSQKEENFRIDKKTGEIFTKRAFDREGSDGKILFLTVKAKDHGNPPLEGYCTLRVQILDVNDNNPEFDRESYRESVSQRKRVNERLFTITATDLDAGANAMIEYRLEPPQDYFEINANSGFVILKKPLLRKEFNFKAIATDKGDPPRSGNIPVTINVVHDTNVVPPKWEHESYIAKDVPENVSTNFDVITVKATGSSGERIIYRIMVGNTVQTNKRNTFILQQETDSGFDVGKIKVNAQLDFEDVREYNLTVRAELSGSIPLASETTVHIRLEDVNDEVPLFSYEEQGSVLENEAPGTEVFKVTATDRDGTPPFNKVTYSINEGADLFSIELDTGVVRTKKEFDREQRSSYQIEVVATDSAPSSRISNNGLNNSMVQFFRITIADKNDNKPSFSNSEYTANVKENEDVGHLVITVTATDDDESSQLRYQLTTGNDRGAFGVSEQTGIIFVAGSLDYETKKQYELILVAMDGIFETSTKIIINIDDVNDLPPKFGQNTYEIALREEDSTDLPKTVLTVVAQDGDTERPQNIVYFLSGQGTQPPEMHFSINNRTGEIEVLGPLDRDYPKGRPEWRFTVLASDEGGGQGSLSGYAEVIVKLTDVNDNAPQFNSPPYEGYVLEENPNPGELALTMKAVDYDDPNTNKNAVLKYAIVQNAQKDGKDIFTINEDDASIKTAICCLDREKVDRYTIVVTATDGGGLTGTGTATIHVDDINDNPPRFDKPEYTAEVKETYGDIAKEPPVLMVKVLDEDKPDTNQNYFEVRKESGPGWDRFTLRMGERVDEGLLIIYRPLDYEDPHQKNGYDFQIMVDDMGGNSNSSLHQAFARVKIKLIDINDNAPEFEKSYIEVNISEGVPQGTNIATFKATDKDNNGMSKVRYVIDRSTNRRRHFIIAQNSNGEAQVNILRNLDREENSKHIVRILAIDDGKPPKTSTATLVVNVLDVNDNAPTFCDELYGYVVENSPGPFPELVFDKDGQVLQIEACDRDDHAAGNGPKFSFSMGFNAPDSIIRKFKVENIPNGGLNQEGIAQVFAKEAMDREEQKTYNVPIKIVDSGRTPMTGTSTLTVVVKDLNDNEMTDGTTEMHVYNFKGKFPKMVIGRVYATDRDDDDWVDKTYSWIASHPQFVLNETSGELTMLNGTREGTYAMVVEIKDQVRQEKAKSMVSVRVENIPLEAVYKSGSIRIKGMSEQEFVSVWDYKRNQLVESKRDLLRKKIAEIIGAKEENVQIFTVLKSKHPNMLDVRFAAHGSPYYKPEKLNGELSEKKLEIEEELGIDIVMVGVDDCLYENVNCEGSCSNELMINAYPHTIISPRSSFVGVHSFVEAVCKCIAREEFPRESCKGNPCYNAGTCVMEFNGVKCLCPKGFDGPRCEQTTRSFQGNGYAWFPPLKQCENSHLSLEFLTEADGLIFYNGPITEPDKETEIVQDFISLELVGEKPRLLLDFGSGTRELNLRQSKSLTDGEWHRIDIFWEPELITLMVDMCTDAMPIGDDEIDHSACKVEEVPEGLNEYLNVNGPLQLGGVKHKPLDDYKWDFKYSTIGFKGCIRNFIHNSVMYDLETPGVELDSKPGCLDTEQMCLSNDIESSCINGICVASLNSFKCLCKPGFYGKACELTTSPVFFDEDSFVNYSVTYVDTAPQYFSEFQLRYRAYTGNPDGEIMYVPGTHNSFLVLELVNTTLQFRYNLNGSPTQERRVALHHFHANDGYWHTVHVTRYGSMAFLSVDGGGGKYYNESTDYEGLAQFITTNNNVLIGGHFEANSGIQVNDFYKACMDDVRYPNVFSHFPMPPNEMHSDFADVWNFTNLTPGCNSSSCVGAICPELMHCVELFFTSECICKPGFELDDVMSTGACIDIDECDDYPSPCKNGGKCFNLFGSFECHCEPPYTGTFCEILQEKREVRLGMGALAAILICVLVIFVLVLLLIIYSKNRSTNYGPVDPDDDIRENIINYNDEGGGEDDMNTYDINPLRIPIDASGMPLSSKPGPEKPYKEPAQNRAYSPDDPNVGEFINNNLGKANDDPDALPMDDLRVYAYEGGGSDAGSLSSLASGTDDDEQDFDYLNGWGPRFQKLADMYGQGESEEE